jgi:hypothetical protein
MDQLQFDLLKTAINTLEKLGVVAIVLPTEVDVRSLHDTHPGTLTISADNQVYLMGMRVISPEMAHPHIIGPVGNQRKLVGRSSNGTLSYRDVESVRAK